jgi:phage terminase large subunit GpA-like protein
LCIKNASKQGNPVKLALARTTTYPDKKEILLSSPSNEEGESGIISFWGEGTQAKLEHECPNFNCRHYQVLDFERMDLDTAMLACEKCGAYFEQWQWQQGVGSFRWNHEFPDDSTTASFWMTGLDSPWLDWKIDIIDDYKNCKKIEEQGDDSQMRVFVNSKLTKEFRRRGKTVDIDLYHDRREVYECHTSKAEVPDGVILITAGVDVQDSFIVYDVVGWGRGRESWMLETGNFQGDPRIPDSIVWKQLDEFVYRRIWRYSNGDYIRTRLMFVDSGGHATDDVYKYCKSRHPRCFAIKGVEGSGNAIIVGGGLKRRQKIVEGVWLIKVGSDTIKDELHTRLAITNIGPGYCHWPMLPNSMPACGYTLEYFEEIISEQREIKYNKAGFAEYKWTKNRTDPNEALDCQVYARAALEYLKVRLEQMPRDIVKIGERDIDMVEIGLGREIVVEKERIRTKPKVNQYGGQTVIGGSDISSTSIFGQEEGSRERGSREGSSQGSGYGAVGTSF